MIRKVLAVVLLAVVAAGAWVRLAPDDAARWHVDPAVAESTGRPNERLLRGADAPLFAETPEALMARLDAAAMAEPRVSRLAGDPADGFVTYVQRSALWGFPDYVSVRAAPEGGGARLLVWSRSRYGHSDLGVNAARVERWLSALGATAG
jgi:hypothetical protein